MCLTFVPRRRLLLIFIRCDRSLDHFSGAKPHSTTSFFSFFLFFPFFLFRIAIRKTMVNTRGQARTRRLQRKREKNITGNRSKRDVRDNSDTNAVGACPKGPDTTKTRAPRAPLATLERKTKDNGGASRSFCLVEQQTCVEGLAKVDNLKQYWVTKGSLLDKKDSLPLFPLSTSRA
jgi:hypothetical protein